MHSVGRFLADYGAVQHMFDEQGDLKLVDVDCVSEAEQHDGAQEALVGCLGMDDFTARRVVRRPGVGTSLLHAPSIARDTALAAAVACTFLSGSQRDRMRDTFASIASPTLVDGGSAEIGLNALGRALVDRLADQP